MAELFGFKITRKDTDTGRVNQVLLFPLQMTAPLTLLVADSINLY